MVNKNGIMVTVLSGEVARKWADTGQSSERDFSFYPYYFMHFLKFINFLNKLPIQIVQKYKQELSQH